MLRPAAFSIATVVFSTLSAAAFAQPTTPSATPGTAAKPSADTVEPAAAATAKLPVRDKGASFQLHMGGMVPFGHFVNGASMQDLVTKAYSADLRLAMYPTKHVGITLGAAGDVYSGTCDDQKNCGGVGYRIPFGVELALENRVVGPFAAININLISGISLTDQGDSVTFRANLREGELALGWRIPLPSSGTAFVPRLGFMVGEYDDAKLNLVRAKGMDGSIPSEVRELHYSIALYAGYHFGS